jgi:hypothetical protein
VRFRFVFVMCFVSTYALDSTLDTPTNRSGMPGADFADWTPCDEVADKVCLRCMRSGPASCADVRQVVAWTSGRNVPTSGSLLVPDTKAGATRWSVVTLSVNKRDWATAATVLLSQ